MSKITTPVAALMLTGLFSLAGCSREIDMRQTHIEQGLIYKKDASDPFTGTLTNVDVIEVGKRYAAQYGAWEGSCNVPVKDGQFDGTAVCKDAKGKQIGEFAYSKGQIDGVLKMWASDSGNLMMSSTIHGGEPDGVEERYNPKTGKIISRINYQAGKKAGEEKRWDITGETLLTDLVWENGKQTGVSRSGEREEHYKGGVPDGVWKSCELNREIPMERLKPNYDKAQAYNALAEKLGGTYFLPALVDGPSGVVCKEAVYQNGIKQAAAVSSTVQGTGDACLDSKIAAFRKENGEDVPINHDVIQEWESGCKK